MHTPRSSRKVSSATPQVLKEVDIETPRSRKKKNVVIKTEDVIQETPKADQVVVELSNQPLETPKSISKVEGVGLATPQIAVDCIDISVRQGTTSCAGDVIQVLPAGGAYEKTSHPGN